MGAAGEGEPGLGDGLPEDHLWDGRRIRILHILDMYSRACLRIEVDRALPGLRGIRALEGRRKVRGLPERILADNGPEFTCLALDQWAHARAGKLQFIEPGRPMQNGPRESFNGKFRDECLNQHGFRDMEEARPWTEEYRMDYNQQRPHGALGNLTQEELVRGLAGAAGLGGVGGGSGKGVPLVNQETIPAGLSLEVFQ